jgi:pimeloyl-ACP methyl ester carboxylesterase
MDVVVTGAIVTSYAAGKNISTQDLVVRGGKIKTRVHIKGDGPPLIFFHGLLGLHWGGYLESLAERFTVYAPEYPGTTPGSPQVVYDIWDVLDLVLFYDDIVSALDIESAVVVGESLGGMVALEYTAAFPQKVSKLVVAAPYGLWREDLPIENYARYGFAELPQLFSSRPDDPEVREFFPFSKDGEEYLDAATNFTWTLGVATKFLWPIPERGLSRRIHRVTVPVQLIWGTADRLIPSAYAELFGQLLADSALELVEGAGHTTLLDAADVVAKASLSFLEEADSAGARRPALS